MATSKGIKATGKKNQALDSIINASLKRKSSNVETNELLPKTKVKNTKNDSSLNRNIPDVKSKLPDVKRKILDVKSEIPNVKSKTELEYKEPIFYDEYLEGGIPDNLLEGLGFNSNGGRANEGEEDEGNLSETGQDDVDSCNTKIEVVLPGSSPSTVLPLSDPTSLSRTAKHTEKSTTATVPSLVKSNERIGPCRKLAKSTNGSQSAKQSTRKRTRNKQPVNPICQSDSAIDLSNKSTTKLVSATGYPHYSITKDNIEYEYKSTGEVVSRIVRDSAKDDKSGKRRKFTSSELTSFPPDSSDDCPINAVNIEDVLDELHKETESTRIKLSSMRDDLRRVGAHNNIMKTKEQLIKAAEVSRRVLKVYAAYKGMLENLEKSTDKTKKEEFKDSQR